MRLNALWWWIDRWRKSTAFMDMTLAEQGAYRNLLDEAQLRGGAIPNDERILGKASGDAREWRKVRGVVMARFTLTEEGWRNATLDAVLKESHRRAEKQANWRNKKGNGGGNAVGNAVGNAGGNTDGSPYPSPSPDRELNNPPTPLSAKGGRPRRLRASEKRRIVDNTAVGSRSCPHEPMCPTIRDCTAKAIADARQAS